MRDPAGMFWIVVLVLASAIFASSIGKLLATKPIDAIQAGELSGLQLVLMLCAVLTLPCIITAARRIDWTFEE